MRATVMSPSNRQLLLATRPAGPVDARHFKLVEAPIPRPGPGEALVRVVWLGIDPTQRTWLNATATYAAPVRIGEVMRGSGVGLVVASDSDRLSVGDWVAGETGWQDYVVAGGEGLFGLNRVPDGIDPKAMLSIYGVNGLTACFGMTEIGRPEQGSAVFVSGAAGSVGSIAGQIAKIKGARVIGSAGGPEKCGWVTDVARFDACIDYKSEDVALRLRDFAPDGIDIAFDNVGGPILETALENLAPHARVVLCGGIASGYGENAYGAGPRNYMQLAFKRARMEGFIFLDFVARFPQAFADLSCWVAEGRLTYREDIVDGLENAPAALQGLFEGRNLGKQLVKVCEPDPELLAEQRQDASDEH